MSDDDDTFDPYASPATTAPLNDDWAARRDAADAARHLIAKLVATTSDAATLHAVAASIRQQTERLAEVPNLMGRLAFETHDDGRHGTSARLGYELNPVDGKCNPISPPFNTWIEGDTAHGITTLGWQYEGPPNCVHGGFVCALFDQFLGIAQRLTGQPGVTGTITVRLQRPTPLCTELHLTGRVREVKGRKNLIEGEIRANGIVTASCEALFIHVSRDRFRQLLAGG